MRWSSTMSVVGDKEAITGRLSGQKVGKETNK